MLHFGVEVEIDRKQDIGINLGIFKFLIEDINKDSYISLPFRVSFRAMIPVDDHVKSNDRILETKLP